MEKEKVLEIEIIKTNDEYSVAIITHQDERVLKRGEFKDEELRVYSVDYPYLNNFTLLFYLRGDTPEKDRMPFIVKNENVDYLINLVNKINEKYGIVKRWRAEKKENYYFVDSCIEIFQNTEMGLYGDNTRYKAGNYFKTEEEARIYAYKFREILKERE